MKLTIPICTWKSPDLLNNCLGSLINASTVETKIIVIIQEIDHESIKICEKLNIEYINIPKNMGALLAIDFVIPFLNSEYISIINDDMIFPVGWDAKLINTIEKNYPCTASAVLVERSNLDPLYQKNVISDDLGEINELTFDLFNNKYKQGFYKKTSSFSRQHPLILKTEDFLKVNGYTDGWDMSWFPGYCLDDYFPYKLLHLNQNYKFILDGDVAVYHGVARTISKLQDKEKYNPEIYFQKKTNISTFQFRKLIGEFE
jgi:GT2 family glycosyltransferase